MTAIIQQLHRWGYVKCHNEEDLRGVLPLDPPRPIAVAKVLNTIVDKQRLWVHASRFPPDHAEHLPSSRGERHSHIRQLVEAML